MNFATAALNIQETCETNSNSGDKQSRCTEDSEEDKEAPAKKFKSDHAIASTSSKEKPCLNWVLDNKFRKEQARLNIPENPFEWTVAHVKHWFQWAIKQFDLVIFRAFQKLWFILLPEFS